MLSSNTWKRSGGKGEGKQEQRWWSWRMFAVLLFYFFLVYQYQDIIDVKCTKDDKYLVLWHCSSHTRPRE